MRVNDKIVVQWRYENKLNNRGHETVVTTCSIIDLPSKEVKCTGTATKYVKDAFDKNKARMVSLSHALQGIPKAKRAQFYEVYRNQTQIPRW